MNFDTAKIAVASPVIQSLFRLGLSSSSENDLTTNSGSILPNMVLLVKRFSVKTGGNSPGQNGNDIDNEKCENDRYDVTMK